MEKMTIVYTLLIVLSAIPILIGIIKMKKLNAFKKNAVKSMATVTLVERRFGLRTTYYLAKLEYRNTDTNQLWTAGTLLVKKKIAGDQIPLWYLPENPSKFSIDDGKRFPYLIAISGVIFLLIVWFCYRYSK